VQSGLWKGYAGKRARTWISLTRSAHRAPRGDRSTQALDRPDGECRHAAQVIGHPRRVPLDAVAQAWYLVDDDAELSLGTGSTGLFAVTLFFTTSELPAWPVKAKVTTHFAPVASEPVVQLTARL
jgi:hypothetical protein